MPKKLLRKNQRLLGVFVFIFGVVFCLGPGGLSWADTSVPIPQRKPSLEPKGRIVQYTLKDFTKALLNFGQPPVPKIKPTRIVDGPLPDQDAERYRKIFALQDEGQIKEAAAEFTKLKDYRLRGHVLYQRYMHPTSYSSKFDELRNWLELYADHPGAAKIYRLAQKKAPAGFKGKLKKPVSSRGIVRLREPTMYHGQTYRSDRARTQDEKARVKKLRQSLLSHTARGNPEQALEQLKSDEAAALLDNIEYDILQADIAASYMYIGNTKMASDLAEKSAKRSALHVPQAGWIAGLVAWDNRKYRQAAKHFEITARSPYASGWMSAAGSYWAARSHMRSGKVKDVSVWLRRAMDHPRTFYGLIATRALGRDFDFNWKVPTYTRDYHDILSTTPAGFRALALVAAGQEHRAEAELLRVTPEDEEMRDALLAYAGYAGLPSLAMRLGSAIEGPEGQYYDAALYPTGPWKPKLGYRIDPALIHAIMRQESRFNPGAESKSGAKGLMQLMPKTAHYVARRDNFKAKASEAALTDPEMNIEIGQRYLDGLLDNRYVNRDLVNLLVAYNAGPGNLSKWKKRWPDVDDPLLFVELIPSGETRVYVERVLANYWIYRLREGLPTPTLDALASGKNAQYVSVETPEEYQIADNR